MRNKEGIALLLALFTLVIISLLAVAFLETTTIDLQIVSNQLKRNQALYIADAGVEYAVSQLRSNKNWSTNPPNYLELVFPSGSGNKYRVTYPYNPGIIRSLGILASGEQVTLEAKVSVTGASTPYSVKILYWREP